MMHKGIGAAGAGVFAGVSIVPARLIWAYIPGASLLEPNEAALMTAAISATFVWAAVKLMGVLRTTAEWGQERASEGSLTKRVLRELLK